MSKFRMVHTEFWDDPVIVEEFTPEDKLFFLYLLTNPATTQIGIYTITRKKMAYELGYSIESISSLLRRFIDQHKMIEYNEETRELFIKKWGKKNYRSAGKPIEDLVRKELKVVKHQPFIESAVQFIENDGIRKVFLDFIPNEPSDDTLNDTHNDSYHDRGGEKEERRTIKENKASTVTVDQSKFDELWKSYPKKIDKKKALASYTRAIKKGTSHETIANGLHNYLKYLGINRDWLKPQDGGRWFEKERWDDEYDMTSPANGQFNQRITGTTGAPTTFKDTWD